MRRLSLCAILLALSGSIVGALVVSSRAEDPQPAAATKSSDDPFGADAPAQPKSVPAKRAAKPLDSPLDSADGAPPPGLRPYPPAPAASSRDSNLTEQKAGAAPAKPVACGCGVAGTGVAQEIDRILTPAMAVTPEPAPVDVLSEPASAALAKINTALSSTTEFDFKETPLDSAIEQLKKRHKIEIQLDLAGLKDAGVDPSLPITKHLSGISLGAALRLMLDELQLKYTFQDEVLLITSPQKAENDDVMLTRFYPVKDLVLVRNESGDIQTDFQPLTDLITNTVAQRSWLDNGGTGVITTYVVQDRCLLVISQTQEVHEEIGCLLATLRKAGNGLPKDANDLHLPQRPKSDMANGPTITAVKPASPASAGTGIPATILSGSGSSPLPASGISLSGTAAKASAPATSAYSPGGLVRVLTPEMAQMQEPSIIDEALVSPAEAKIKAALDTPTEIDCLKKPLRQVVEDLAKRHKIEIQLDLPGLKDAGVDENDPITKHLSGISLGAAVRNLLRESQLKYVIHNKVLLITSPQKAESDEFMTTVIYPVKAFVLVKNDKGEIETDFQTLTDLLDNTISPKTWLDNGGTGTVSAYQFQDRCLLVVSQTEEVHEQIAAMLSALHRCVGSDAKKDKEFHLPQLPKAVAAPVVQGGGFF